MSMHLRRPDSSQYQSSPDRPIWIGGFASEAQEAIDEVQMFPPEGRLISPSQAFPGIVEETLKYSWCFIAIPLPKGVRSNDPQVPGFYVVYRAEIDEAVRAQVIRDQRQQP